MIRRRLERRIDQNVNLLEKQVRSAVTLGHYWEKCQPGAEIKYNSFYLAHSLWTNCLNSLWV